MLGKVSLDMMSQLKNAISSVGSSSAFSGVTATLPDIAMLAPAQRSDDELSESDDERQSTLAAIPKPLAKKKKEDWEGFLSKR